MPEYRRNLAASHNNLGVLLADQGKTAEAESALSPGPGHPGEARRRLPHRAGVPRGTGHEPQQPGLTCWRPGKRGEAEAAYRQALAIDEKLAADFPTVPDYAVGLGGSYCNFANLIRESGQPEAALGWYQNAIATLEHVVAQEPRLVTARQFLRNSHLGRARALDALGRHAEATRDWERALELDDGRAKEEIRSNLAVSRLRKFRKDKDAAGCLAAAAEYEALNRNNAGGSTMRPVTGPSARP